MAEDVLSELLLTVGKDYKVVPGGIVTIKTGKPTLVSLFFDNAEVLCGDKVNVITIASAAGFEGKLDIAFQNAADGAEVDKVTDQLKSRAVVTTGWVAKKPADRWDESPDIKAEAKLKDPDGTELSTTESFPNLVITRRNGYEGTMRSAHRSTPQWVDTSGTGAGPWTKTATNYEFACGFDVSLKDGVITITCKIKLVPQGGLVLTRAMKEAWKKEIEGYWNNVYRAHRKNCAREKKCDCENNCCKYEMKIVCEFVDRGQHTTVNVHPGACTGPWGSASWWYSTTWWERKSAVVPTTVRAHEFGHNFGLWDEYKGGATAPNVDPNTYTEPTSSLMHAGNSQMIWHFSEPLRLLAKKTKDPYVVIKVKK